MRVLIFIMSLTLFACGTDNVTHPKLYSFSHLDQSEEGLYVFSNQDASVIDVNTGIYGANRDFIKSESEEFIKAIFYLQEIELLTINTARINYITDEIEYDTTVTYSQDEEEIIIDFLNGTNLIYYDDEGDQFILCGFTLIAIPGPNTLNPGSYYNSLIIEDCQNDADLKGHLDYVLDQYSFESLDTIGLILNKFVYK